MSSCPLTNSYLSEGLKPTRLVFLLNWPFEGVSLIFKHCEEELGIWAAILWEKTTSGGCWLGVPLAPNDFKVNAGGEQSMSEQLLCA